MNYQFEENDDLFRKATPMDQYLWNFHVHHDAPYPSKDSEFELVMQINVNGIFHGCKAALPWMAKRNYGRIVNIASISGKEGNAGMLAYSASKVQ